MGDTTAPPGRDEVLARCLAGLGGGGGGGVLLTGPAGIGRSAVLDAVQGEAERAGALVLRSNSAACEAGLPQLALYDLFAAALAERDERDAWEPDSTALAPHLRAALDAALLRAPAGDGAAGQLALRLAVLELLRALAVSRPVLLVLDDAHCLDPASAQVLAFVARRLAGQRVAVLAAERLADGAEPGCLDLLPGPVTEVALDPLPPAVIGELLSARGGLAPGDPVVERIAAASGGNPGFALALARTARRSCAPPGADEPLPVPRGLRELFAAQLAALTPELLAELLPAATARPVPRWPAGEALGQAFAAGLLTRTPGGEPRFAHPLLRELVYADATGAQRRQCHAALAEQLDDPLEKARHRALATPGPDPALAAELAAAAELAVDRGAPAQAAELARLAAERTDHDPQLAADRLLTAARHARDAGRADQARRTCDAVLRGANRAARVGARLLLVELAGGDRSGVPALLDAAQAEAGDTPGLRAAVQLHRAEHAISTGRPDQGLAELAEAARQAERSGDLAQQLEVIAVRAPIELQLRPEWVLPSLRHATELAARRPAAAPRAASIQIRCCLVVGLLRAGAVGEAIEEVNQLRADVESAGRLKDLADVLHLVASTHERAGRCVQAYQAGRRGGRLRRELGPTPAPGLVLSAAAELNGGTAQRATELATSALLAAEAAGDAEWTAYALGLLGRADLLGRRHQRAAEHLGRCRTLLRGLGFTDPALFLVDADLVEALAWSGALAPAWQLLREAGAEVDRLDRRVLRLGLARARAVLAARDGDPRGAADELRAQLPASHPYPLERARALLTLGDLERRARRRAAARADLRAAAEAFAAAQCLPWLAHTEERLARLDGLDGADGPGPALSELERQIVALVRQGATNRQVAAALHVSVKSVEGSLTRLYRRFGVRDRAGLTACPSAG
ncbi:LuxR family transcriptional regulator [Kitasatospora sp. NBC_01287]|uniref:helix-turn-helix transcriptional regulator n=1 Tax=Kitasatospora sp. NBC_01287 TaxID=2903573 RepID=UPI00224D0169|nr:LuxR family transcriptional regulator [Kitasatospora sp. NBC_01287]MCX4744981.1 LuxR family transcriptional regulator [Kitasatospora sp. NBC_01287]